MARVRGVDHRGRILAEDVVPHGIDPAAVLQALGHDPVWTGSEVVDGELVLVYRVRQGDRPQPHQRLSAYAVVQASFRGVPSLLLTSFARRVRVRNGAWGLPGGGLEPGEDPVSGAEREVWEETGQHVQAVEPLDLVSRHWTGRAPSGRLEDYHAVSMVYRAHCPDPVETVVHDVGGSTADARWVPLADLPTLPVLDWQRRFLPHT